MACLALSLQPINGPDILLHTRDFFPPARALAALASFRDARLSLSPSPAASSPSEDFDSTHLGDDPLAASSGQILVGSAESKYRIVYRLVNSIYVLAISDPSDPSSLFPSINAVNQSVSVLVSACRGVDVTQDKLLRKYPELYLSIELVLRGISAIRLSAILSTIHGDNLAKMVSSGIDSEQRVRGADSWNESSSLDRKTALDAVSSVYFELPAETLAAGDEFAASFSLPPGEELQKDQAEDSSAAPAEEKDPFAASDMVNKPEEALVGGFKKSKDNVSDAAAALAGLEVTTLPPAEATKPTFIGVEGFEGDYGGIEFGNEEASLSEAFEGLNTAFGGGLDASEFVTTTKKTHKTAGEIGLELLATSGGAAPTSGAGTPLENLLVTKTTEMTVPEMHIEEEINAEFRESILSRVGLTGTVFLRTLPLKKAAGKETEFSFRFEGTSGIKRAALQSSVVSSLDNGLFYIKTVAKEEPIPVLKYSLQPKHTPLPLRVRLLKRHSGTMFSVMIQYASNPHLPAPLTNVTFILKLPVDPSLLNVSPKGVLNRTERELRWNIPEIPLNAPSCRLRARMPVDQDAKDGELDAIAMVKFSAQGLLSLSGVSLRPSSEGIAQFNEVSHTYASRSYLCT